MTSIDRAEATNLARKVLGLEHGESSVVLLDEKTREEPFGWLFYYQSRAFIETGDIGSALAGNGPILVLRASGEVRRLGTAHPEEFYLAEILGDPNDVTTSGDQRWLGMARRSDAWRALVLFVRELEPRGYGLRASISESSAREGRVRLTHPNLEISIESDRGEWTIEITPVGIAKQTLAVWSVCLDDPIRRSDLEGLTNKRWDLARQLEWLRAHMEYIESASAPYRRSTTDDCLSAARRATDLAGFVVMPASRDIRAR